MGQQLNANCSFHTRKEKINLNLPSNQSGQILILKRINILENNTMNLKKIIFDITFTFSHNAFEIVSALYLGTPIKCVAIPILITLYR